MTFQDRFDLQLVPYNAFADLMPSINEPFEKLDEHAAHLHLDNTFTGNVTAATLDLSQTGTTSSPAAPDVVVGLVSGQTRLRLWPLSALAPPPPPELWTWTGASLTPVPSSRTINVGGASINGNASVTGSLRVTSGLATDNGYLYFRNDNGISLQWDGTFLKANTHLMSGGNFYYSGNGGIYTNWDGAGINHSHQIRGPSVYVSGAITTPAHVDCRGLYLPTGGQGGRPAYVLGQSGDGWCNWWPANAIGPPAGAQILAASGDFPRTDAMKVICTIWVNRTGYWFAFATMDHYSPPNGSPINHRLLVGGGTVWDVTDDTSGTNDSSRFRLGAYWTGGVIGAGTAIQLYGSHGQNGPNSTSAILYAVFVPTSDYPN